MKRSDNSITRRRYLAMMAGTAAAMLPPTFCWGENERAILRLAVSVETLAGANINDARTAYRVWIGEVLRQIGTKTAEVVPEVFLPSAELIRGIRQGMIDCYGVTGLEFEKVADLTDPDSLVIKDYLANGMEYVLLVHNKSPFKKLADLRDARMVSHLHREMVLLPAWLGTMLAANNLPQPEQFFRSHELRDRLNLVVLPVFFRRVDAACLARRNWETAVELNPQLGREVRVLAVSPRVVPVAFAFRRNTNSNSRKALIDSIQRINTVAGGKQIVALYQSSGFIVRPTSIMKNTLEMIQQFERVTAQQQHFRKGRPESMLKITGIARRTMLLAWTVTLFTLGIFVAIMLPEKKRDLQAGLESEASGVAVALQGEVAEAAVSEDYSSVVEHAMRVLDGDKAVDFLVITKNDGLSVVVERNGWRMEPKTDSYWYPALRRPFSQLGVAPMFNRRVFHYAVPFDYSSIEWGRIHVGLSLNSYDQSARQVNLRTGILAVVCVLISLLASVLYAGRFVRPILQLQSVFERVAGGDLTARADIRSRDEIEHLAQSFNSMADMILHRDQELSEAKSDLELRVTERTQELCDQIIAKDSALAQLAEAQKRLIDLSRISGMAEVATGVLHNVGNVLNSVNVSATIVADHLRESRVSQIGELVRTLEDHKSTLSDSLTNDPRGQRVLPYMSNLSQRLGVSDNYVVLKKPFDIIEVSQLAHALTAKWTSMHQARLRTKELDRLVEERTAELSAANVKLNLLAAALKAAASSISITDSIGTLVWTNPAFSALSGYSAEEVLGSNRSILKSGMQDDEFYKGMWAAISSEEVWRGDVINRRENGSLTCEEMTITPVASEPGNITHFVTINQDITQRKEAEGALREAEEKYRAIFEDAVVGIFQSTPEGQLVNINRAFATMHGYESPEQFLEETSRSARPHFINAEQLMEWTQVLENHGTIRSAEVEVRCRDQARK